jgi:hypothetical protein
MVTTFMGLTSSRDVTVSRTLSIRTESRPTLFLVEQTVEQLASCLGYGWTADFLFGDQFEMCERKGCPPADFVSVVISDPVQSRAASGRPRW